MHVLTCPDCSAVMHLAEKIDRQSIQDGQDQISRHSFEQHILPHLNAMLEFTAALVQETDVAGLKQVMSLTCPGCGTSELTDSTRYVCFQGRTRLCCSEDCFQRVRAQHQR